MHYYPLPYLLHMKNYESNTFDLQIKQIKKGKNKKKKKKVTGLGRRKSSIVVIHLK